MNQDYILREIKVIFIFGKQTVRMFFILLKRVVILENYRCKRKEINRIPVPKQFLKEVVMNLLLEPISKEVENYYKEPKLWYRGSEKYLK